MQLKFVFYLTLFFLLPQQSFSAPRTILFDPVKNGVQFPDLTFEYDLESDPAVLSMGPISLSATTFNLKIGYLKNIEPELAKKAHWSDLMTIALTWPKDFFQKGTIEIITDSGEVLFEKLIDESDSAAWVDKINVLARTNRLAIQKISLAATQYGILPFEPEKMSQLKKKGQIVRACLVLKDQNYQSRTCTGFLQNVGDGEFVAIPRVENTSALALNAKVKVPLKGDLPTKAGQPFQFFATTDSGISLDLYVLPHVDHHLDLAIDGKNEKLLTYTGTEATPIGGHKLILIFIEPDFFKRIGWTATIGEFTPRWRLAIPIDKPQYYLSGLGGGIFKQTLILPANPPHEAARPMLASNALVATYNYAPPLHGTLNSKFKADSTEINLRQKSQDPGKTQFEWDFLADEKGEYQTRYMSIVPLELPNAQSKASWFAGYRLYRSMASELSYRITGILAGNSAIVLSEGAYNQWFDSFFGWRNYWVGQQRWGMSLKQFQTVATLGGGSKQASTTIKQTTIDLKYRLTPGVWGLDETWGIIAGFTTFSLGETNTGMYGGGFFWARSMPKIFDDIFNIVPIMRYPKWVDLEYLYYPIATNRDLTPGMNSNLNFHGKVMWSKQIFGEAGFGLKTYDLKNFKKNRLTQFTSLYGTVGLGIMF